MTGAFLTVTVGNRVDELARLYEAIENFADGSRLPQSTRRTLLLIVEELVTNIVRHGYEPGVADSIVIAMGWDGEDVVLTIHDSGTPFDSGRAPVRQPGESTLEATPIGGLGLFLVHEFARSVTSRRDGGVNVTEVRVPIRSDDSVATDLRVPLA